MAAEAFLIKLGHLTPDEQRSALCNLPDTKKLTERFERAWELRDRDLGGIPYLAKDLYFRAGYPTYAGSTFLPEEIGLSHSTSTLPLAFENDAGAVFCGNTQLNEFAYGLTGENPHYGDCHHPTHSERLTGGSSSGSAWAVAKGLTPFALATDTAGSIRVPCGYCGVWGLRLSPNVAPVGDIFPLSPGFDTQGWITQNVPDLVTVSKAVLGDPPPCFTGLWAGDLGLGLPDEVLQPMREFALNAGAVEDRAAMELLRMTFAEAAEIYPILGGHAAARVHAPWLVRRKDQYDPIVLSRLELGLRRSPEEMAWAETEQRRILDAFAAIFARYSFIALPCTGGPAITKAEATLEHRRQLLALNTPGSLAGLPALAAPVDLGDGLTAGVQFLFPDMLRFGWQGPLENLNLL